MERVTVVLRRLSLRGTARKSGFLQLFVSKRLIHGLATSMLALFVPIFLYEISGGNFLVVSGFYIAVGALYVLLLPFATKYTSRIGFSRILAISMVFAVLHYVLMFFLNAQNLWYLLPFLIVSLALFRTLHWVPYHVDFALFTSAGERGKSVSLMFAAIAFMSMVGPLLAGLIIETYSYSAMFGLSIILLSLAGISYLFVPAVTEQYEWGYLETWRNLWSPQFKNITIGELANGAESGLNLIVWPVFMYLVLNGDMLQIGSLSALIVAVTIVVQLWVGKRIDTHSENSILTLKRGSLFHSLGWLFKMFVASSLHVFAVGLYHNITRIFLATPYSSILYDSSGDQGTYIDEFTVLREMALHSGRVLVLILITGLTFLVPLETTFIIGIFASLLMNMVYRIASH